MTRVETDNALEGIAIIGMAGRFPGAKNVDEFWQNLQNGVESIKFFTDEELLAAGVEPAVLTEPNYVKAGSPLEDIELFDAAFFGYSPREAAIIDPQHRLFLECAWEALENSGYDPQNYAGRIGTYAGAGFASYLLFNLATNRQLLEAENQYQVFLGNDKDFLSTRVAYQLNLKGPSINVQTACSTSLVAVSMACQGLLNYQCDMALAGGITISASQKSGYFYQQGSILSPDGHCRAFDAKAEGTVVGNGAGIVVLKRLEDALAEGDCIHAVIKGFGLNNDGGLKVGYTAPSIDGQADAIAEAIALADIDPETITYIETHGTGTALGDPIEIAALTKVFRAHTQKRNFCAIGSLKTNIGHLDAAAGVAGLIKTVLALKHQQIPPSLNFETPNSQIDFASSPFYVNTQLSQWKSNGTPRRAGVSSFGIGGTNTHVIVEEAPFVKQQKSREAEEQGRKYHLLTLSAKTDSALEKATENLRNYLKQHPELNLADVAYTLQVGRRHFQHRRAVICRDSADAIAALQEPKRVLTNIQETSNCSIVFMFPGQGAQYVNMGKELYQTESVFREQVDICCQLLQPHLGLDMRSLIYPNTSETEATEKLKQTDIAQPALFVIEYALAKLWMSWGISPQATIGHSIGEYVAACLAGVFSLEDALALVAVRGKLMQQLPAGAMLAVSLPATEVQTLLNETLSLATNNGPNSCVVAGTHDAIQAFQEKLNAKGIDCRLLHTSHAFHSFMMEPILLPFIEEVKKIQLNSPKIPFISNITGTWITNNQATDPNYWAKHLRQTVQFAPGISELLQQPNRIFLEVGPGRTLRTLAQQQVTQITSYWMLSSLPHPQEQQSDVEFLLTTLGRLWLAGVPTNWADLYANERRSRIPLPTYPFERQRYWIEPQKQTSPIKSTPEVLEEKLNLNDWFYIPSWKRSVLPVSLDSAILQGQQQCWLVFLDQCGLGVQLIERLKREKQDVISVRISDNFCCINEENYTINPKKREDYDSLIKSLRNQGKIPTTITHLWTITPPILENSKLEEFETIQYLGFYSLLFLAQVWAEQHPNQPLQIKVVSNQLQAVLDEPELCPEKATILGACRVIPQEYPHINCCSIDIPLPEANTKQWQQLMDRILTELTAKASEKIIAYRGNCRWIQYFEPIKLENKTKTKFRAKGVYLITGGLGTIGLVIAEHLAKTVQAKLVLIGRSGLPQKSEWTQWLSNHQENNSVSQKIKKVQHLEELGAEVLVLAADVANLEQMQAVVIQAKECFGEIHGVIHAAGVPGAGLIQLKTTEMAASVLEPKLKGTLVLDAVFQNAALDFMLLFSSNTAITGGIGQIDYCAANAFLDAFAHHKFPQSSTLTVAINWDWWQGDNWADSLMASVPEIQAKFKQKREKYGITFEEGINVLTRILSSQIPQVIVTTQKIEKIIEEYNSFSVQSQAPQSHPRPHLSTTYTPPSNPVEQNIANLWQELLGIEKVGIHDNFFDLGGHSLLATQVISQLRQDFQVELSLRSLFEAPTIAELALTIEEMLIAELDALTEEEIRQLEMQLEV